MENTITTDEILALHAVRKGADVYAYDLAKHLRSVEKKRPELVTICRAMDPPPGREQQPYFGAIATDEGQAFLRRQYRMAMKPS